MGAQWKAKGKALVADAKGRLFTKLVKEITVAARGGPDPAANAKLRLVVEQARDVLFWGVVPDPFTWACGLLVAGGVAWLGFTWFQKTRKGFADVL